MKRTSSAQNSRRQAGFSLIEFLVAIAVFIVIGGAAVQVYSRHMPLYRAQQEMAALNIGLRNAVSQLQLDLANAGTGVYTGVNVAHFPVGVTVRNRVSAGCFDAVTQTYTDACFDQLNIVAVDNSIPPVHPTDIGTNCVSTTSSIAFTNPVPGMTLTDQASLFHDGDMLLFVKGDGSQMTVVTLTQDGQVSGGKVQLQHNPTGAGGINTAADDPLELTLTNASNKLGDTFCDNDWVLKLNPIFYRVDAATDRTRPVLLRIQGNSQDIVAEQIIGFKVGVTLWNDPLATTDAEYNFDANSYNFDYTRIRSVRISLIGRTTPNQDPNNRFRNTFDQGPYQIQVMSVVANPRNLNLND